MIRTNLATRPHGTRVLSDWLNLALAAATVMTIVNGVTVVHYARSDTQLKAQAARDAFVQSRALAAVGCRFSHAQFSGRGSGGCRRARRSNAAVEENTTQTVMGSTPVSWKAPCSVRRLPQRSMRCATSGAVVSPA